MVPLKPGTGLPARKWRHLTSTPPGSVAVWWPGPSYNPGVITGPSGLVVIDLDTAEHGTDMPPEWAEAGAACGADVLAILAGRAGEVIPATYTVTTWRGGTHLYFIPPTGMDIRNSVDRIGPMIDVRGRGGLAVAAGSVRGGKTYELADDREPVALPAWLAELAAQPSAPPSLRPVVPLRPADGYAAAAVRAEMRILADAPAGTRNHELNRSAFSLGQLVAAEMLDEDQVSAALLRAAERNGLLADDGIRQCEATIRSGLRAGMANPRQVVA
jgi:hypothetical protein